MESATQNRRKMRGTTAAIQQVARAMRKDMTPAEQALWGALSGKQLNGLRFRAQHSAGQFILDFYCPLHKLVVEVDGSIHEGNEA